MRITHKILDNMVKNINHHTGRHKCYMWRLHGKDASQDRT